MFLEGLGQLELSGIEPVVPAFLFQKLFVVALLFDLPVLDDHNAVGIAHGGEPVGNDKHRPSLHEGVHALLDEGLGAGVDGGSGLVQDHHRGIGHGGPGDGQQLALSLGEVGSVAGDHGLVALGEAADEGVGVGTLGGGNALLVGGVQTAVADVVHNGAGEEVGVLKNRTQRPAQVVLADGAYVDAVVGDHAALDLVEAVDEVGNGGLACAGGAHEGNLLAGVGVDRYVLQNPLARHIGEVHMVKAHGALELGEVVVLAGDIAHGAADQMEGGFPVLVRVLPGPAVAGEGRQVSNLGEGAVRGHLHPEPLLGVGAGRQKLEAVLLPYRLPQLGEDVPLHQNRNQSHSGAAGSLPGPDVGAMGAGIGGECAVGVLLHLHQRDAALVHLGLGVHHLKDALGAGQSGEEGGHLLGDLVQRLAHLLGVVEVDHQTAQVKALKDGQQSAEGGGEGVADVHEVAGDGHDHDGIEVCLLSGVPVGVVEGLELFLGLLLVGKGLDDLQTLDDLLDLAVDVTQSGLLLLVEAAAAAAQALKEEDGQNQKQSGDQKELPVDEEHEQHQAHEHQGAGAKGHDALFQSHLHIVRVVGEAAHELAVGMLIKVAQRQGLQFIKQVLAQAVDTPLRQADHHGGLAVGGHTAHQIDAHQLEDGKGQTGKVGAAGPDKVVDDAAHHIGAAQVAGHGEDQKQQYGQQRQLAAGQIAHQAAGRFCHILRLGIAPTRGMIGSWHYSPPPSC